MNDVPDLDDAAVAMLREFLRAYLELMLEHYAKTKRACLRRSQSPREDTPADAMMMGAADSAGKALGVVNYCISQTCHDKNIVTSWLRSHGIEAESN